MIASSSGSRQSQTDPRPPRVGGFSNSGMVSSGKGLHWEHGAEHSFVDLGDSTRIALMLTPRGRGSLQEQVAGLDTQLKELQKQVERQNEAVQQAERDQAEAAARLAEHRLRAAAARSMARSGSQEARDTLERLAGDPEVGVRIASFGSLGSLGSSTAISPFPSGSENALRSPPRAWRGWSGSFSRSHSRS